MKYRTIQIGCDGASRSIFMDEVELSDALFRLSDEEIYEVCYEGTEEFGNIDDCNSEENIHELRRLYEKDTKITTFVDLGEVSNIFASCDVAWQDIKAAFIAGAHELYKEFPEMIAEVVSDVDKAIIGQCVKLY